MEPQKPQKSRKKPLPQSLKSRNQSRKKPQLPPTEKPQKPQPKPQIPAPEPQKAAPESLDLSSGSGMTNAAPREDFTDLINEAQELQPSTGEAAPGDPAAKPQDEPQKAALPAIEIKPIFAGQITNLAYAGMRYGTRYFANGDLAPLTDDQRKNMNQCMSDLAAKHLPRVLLQNQEEVGGVGVLVGIWVENYRPNPKKEPAKEPEKAATT